MNGPLPAALVLVQTRPPWTVPWRCQAILSKNVTSGLTYTTLEGQASVQVADPARFCGAILSAGGKDLAAGSISPTYVLETFLRGNLEAVAAAAVPKLNLPPEQAAMGQETIRIAAGHAAAAWLSSVGLHCTAFDLNTVAAPRRTPCVICKSATAPTGYAKFQRVISLVYIRFMANKEGNFCVPCALKTSAAFNGVMLVAGWWGVIGFLMTPIFFCQNIYYLAHVVSSAKATTQPVS